MKKYISIHNYGSWKFLLPKIKEETILLLNKSEGDFILAWGKEKCLEIHKGKYDSDNVQQFIDENKTEYIFGYLSYDIKNNVYRKISSETPNQKTVEDKTKTNDLFFFVPEHIIIVKNDNWIYFGEYSKDEVENVFKEKDFIQEEIKKQESILLESKTKKATYLKDIESIKQNIQKGIIYEVNYCIHFESDYTHFNSVATFLKLNKTTDAPFSSYFTSDQTTILSASPERFLKRKGNMLISQPIKGTAKRSADKKEDAEILNSLCTNEKEISENIMIVDLVRNDLSKISTKNSVKVNELCKPYSFKTVHQLISNVSCSIADDLTYTKILEALFPMGSMTGAPKISAMNTIAHFERFSRGIYSGAIGYIDPNGNFDFNVVIRSIVVDAVNNNISCSVGGAITIKSDPEMEYEECLLKLNAIQKALC